MTILLVDDEPELTEAVGLNLRDEGWEVVTARSGPGALELLGARQDVEILATDFNMPEMDGAELVNKALALRPDLYTIVFTGWEDRNYAIRALRVGADDFIDKEQDFGAKLNQAIRRGFQEAALGRMGRQLLRVETEREVLDLAVRTLSDIGRFDGFCLAVRGWAGDSYRIERAIDLRTGNDFEARDPLSTDSAYRHVIQTRKIFYPPISSVEGRRLEPYLRNSRSIIVVPVLVHDSEQGALGIEHHGNDKFKIEDLRFLLQMAQWISLAMEKITNLKRALLERKRTEQEEGLLARTLLHQLKNPLNNLFMAAQEETSITGKDLEDLRANVGRINDVLDRVLRARASQGEESVWVNLGEALEEAVSRFRVFNPRSEVAIEYEAPRALPSITGKREFLVSAFVNLLDNGSAATGGRGRLSIRAYFVPLRGQVEIVFRDDGPGVAAGDLGRIFDYGYTTLGEGHFGHGLALTQEVVQLHGGEITVENGIVPGATFKVVFPVRGGGGSEADAAEGSAES
jgi:signal transduction histidine kinase